MKIEKSTLKIFLTSGVTLTVSADEEVMDTEGNQLYLDTLSNLIDEVLKDKGTLEFIAQINHPYKDEEGAEQNQVVKHYYHIPSERISWYIIEEV